jgi:hypothetical protein
MSKGGMAALAAGVALGLSSGPQGLFSLGQEAFNAAGLSLDHVRSEIAAKAIAVVEPVGAHVGIGAALKAVDAAVVSGAPGGFNATISSWLHDGAQAHGHAIADVAEAADRKLLEDRRKRDGQAVDAAVAAPGVKGSLSEVRQEPKKKRDTLGTNLPIV